MVFTELARNCYVHYFEPADVSTIGATISCLTSILSPLLFCLSVLSSSYVLVFKALVYPFILQNRGQVTCYVLLSLFTREHLDDYVVRHDILCTRLKSLFLDYLEGAPKKRVLRVIFFVPAVFSGWTDCLPRLMQILPKVAVSGQKLG